MRSKRKGRPRECARIRTAPLFSILMLLASSSALSAAVTAWFKRGDVDATMAEKKADAAKPELYL